MCLELYIKLFFLIHILSLQSLARNLMSQVDKDVATFIFYFVPDIDVATFIFYFVSQSYALKWALNESLLEAFIDTSVLNR